MAKGRGRKSSGADSKASGTAREKNDAPLAKAAAKVDRALRKHTKRLQSQLADAARAEAKRIRRLERARWRRQRLEAAVDEARTASSIGPSGAAPKVKATPKVKAKAAPKVKAKAAPKVKAKAAPKVKAKAAPKVKAKAAPEAKIAAEANPKAAAAAPKAAAAAPKAAATPKAAAAAPPATDAPVIEAYCLREKRRVQMLDPKPVVTANGGSALSGTCPSCGAALYKLVSRTAR
jgi:translation initiation factor IF-2